MNDISFLWQAIFLLIISFVYFCQNEGDLYVSKWWHWSAWTFIMLFSLVMMNRYAVDRVFTGKTVEMQQNEPKPKTLVAVTMDLFMGAMMLHEIKWELAKAEGLSIEKDAAEQQVEETKP